MPARTGATPAELDLLLNNVIEQAISVNPGTQIQEVQQLCTLKFKKIESLQRWELYRGFSRLGSPQSCHPQERACDRTHGHMWEHPPTRDTWTG